MTHTPGPWHSNDFLCEGEHALRVAMPDRNGQPTATIAMAEHNWNDAGQYDRRISWKEAEANARLIAAAPDLLDAITGAMDILSSAESNASGTPDWDYVGPRVAAVRAAIARATTQGD